MITRISRLLVLQLLVGCAAGTEESEPKEQKKKDKACLALVTAATKEDVKERYDSEIKAIFADKCEPCHDGNLSVPGIAYTPADYTSFDTALSSSPSLLQRVELPTSDRQKMPPYAPPGTTVVFGGKRSKNLTADEESKLKTWLTDAIAVKSAEQEGDESEDEGNDETKEPEEPAEGEDGDEDPKPALDSEDDGKKPKDKKKKKKAKSKKDSDCEDED